tara:strand:- start:708 stop:1247 length:540 start_codon:yes stop_codon:yes gene_type:complete
MQEPSSDSSSETPETSNQWHAGISEDLGESSTITFPLAESDFLHFKSRDIFIPIIKETEGNRNASLYVAHVKNYSSNNFLYFSSELINSDLSGSENKFGRLTRALKGNEGVIKTAPSVIMGPFSWSIVYAVIEVPYINSYAAEGIAFSEIATLPQFFAERNPPIEFQVGLTNVLISEIS